MRVDNLVENRNAKMTVAGLPLFSYPRVATTQTY